MAILTILKMGHPSLYQPSRKVEGEDRSFLTPLLKKMQKTIEEAGACGLAAPQVDVPLRTLVYRVPKTPPHPRYELTPEYDPEGVPFTVLLNPEITPLGERMTLGWESCLSVPGLRGKVARYHSISVKARTLSGEEYFFEAHGFHARLLQHEVDHLDGVLYPLHIKDLKSFGFIEALEA